MGNRLSHRANSRILEVGGSMQTRNLTIPELMLIAGTRVALGAGLGLLLGGRLDGKARNAAGWALFGVGALSTIPILIGVLNRPKTQIRETA